MPSAKFWKSFVVILLLAAAVDFTGTRRVPLWDRDEPWYAECTWEMVLTGDWVVPRFLGDWRQEKPPMIYWCQAVATEILGHSELAARIPSTLAVLTAIGLLGVYVRRFAGPRRALWAMFILASSGVCIAASKWAITDALLMFSICSGQACLGLMYATGYVKRRVPAKQKEKQPALDLVPAGASAGSGAQDRTLEYSPTALDAEVAYQKVSAAWWVAPLFWFTLAVAALTKGPVALGMDVVSMIALLLLDLRGRFNNPRAWKKAVSWWRHVKPHIGVPIFLAVGVPWLLMLHWRAPGFLGGLVLKAAKHSGESMDGHGAPPGYHTLGIFATFFPWSLLLVAAAIIAWKKQRLPAIRFAMAAAAGPWLLMEMVWTKLPFYVLPSFPALAFLTADAIVRCARGEFNEMTRLSFKVGVGIWAFATVLIGFAPWGVSYWAYHQAGVPFHTLLTHVLHNEVALPIVPMIAFTLGTMIYALWVSLRFARGKILGAGRALGGGMMVIIVILFGTILPNFQFLQLSKEIADDLPPAAHGADVHVAMIGYNEPSLAYYQGGGARKQDPGFLQNTPQDQWPRWMVIDFTAWKDVPPGIRQKVNILAQEWGIAYADKFRAVGVYVLENPAAR